MALQESGTLTFSEIQTEYGGENPISISEYYKGAGYVADTTANTNVPTTGEISLSNFFGGSSVGELTQVGFQAGLSGTFDIGAEQADRLVVVVVTGNFKNGGSMSSCTVNGVSCTVVNDNAGGLWEQAAIGYAVVPTGTGNVSVSSSWSYSSDVYGTSIGVYVARGLNSTTPVETSNVANKTFTTEEGDLLIGVGIHATSTPNWTFDGNAATNQINVSGAYMASSTASYQAVGTSTPVTMSNDYEGLVVHLR